MPQWRPRSVVASRRTRRAVCCRRLIDVALCMPMLFAFIMALAASCCSSHATMVASVRCSSAHSPSFAVCCGRLVDVALCMRSSLAIVLQQPPAAPRMPPMVASVSCSISPHTLSYAGCCSRLVDVAHCMRSSLAIIMAPAASCCFACHNGGLGQL